MQKNIFLLMMVLLTLATLSLASCSTNNDSDNSRDVILNDTSATTGSLRVTVQFQNNRISNAEVKLYPSNEDVTKDQFLFRLFSNSSGDVFFGFLNYGNYYVKASANISGVVRERVIAVQVQARKDLRYTVELF